MPVRRRGNRWEVDVSYQGRRVRTTTVPGASKANARALERKLYEEIEEERLGHAPSRQVSHALEEWLDGDARSLKSHRKLLSHAKATLPYVRIPFQEAPIAAVKMAKAMRRKGLTNATINRRIDLIRRACNLAFQWGWIDVQIGARVRRLPETHVIDQFLEPADVEAIARQCPNSEAGEAVRLLAYTGLRRGEFWRVGSKHVLSTDQGPELHVPRSKGGRARIVPVPDRIAHIAARLPLLLTDAQLRKSWGIAKTQAGFPWARVHDLRHAYISWLVRSGESLRTVQELAGHSTLTMTARYAHLAPQAAREAVRRVFD